MPGYLEQVPDGFDIETVFIDMHQRAEGVTDALDRARVAEYGSGSSEKSVPGTDLSLNWRSGRGGYDTTYVTAGIGSAKHYLISVSSRTLVAEFDRDRTGVKGFRGRELGGDYSLTQLGYQESIVASLGYAGIRGGELPDEPFGVTEVDPLTRITDLGEESARRLKVITQGITDILDGVELMLDGMSASDAFELLGRPVDRY